MEIMPYPARFPYPPQQANQSEIQVRTPQDERSEKVCALASPATASNAGVIDRNNIVGDRIGDDRDISRTGAQ